MHEVQCTWGRPAFPPDDGVVNGLKSKGTIWFLNVGCKSTKGVAQRETTFVGTEHFGGLKSGFGVGTKVVDDVPELEAVLEAVRSQDVFDHLGSEAMASTAPKRSQPELCICIHRWTLQKTLLR